MKTVARISGSILMGGALYEIAVAQVHLLILVAVMVFSVGLSLWHEGSR